MRDNNKENISFWLTEICIVSMHFPVSFKTFLVSLEMHLVSLENHWSVSIAYIMRKKSDMGNNNIVALQLISNLMGWSNIRYIYVLIVLLIHIEQTPNVRIVMITRHWIYVSKNMIVFYRNLQKKEKVHRNSQERLNISLNYRKSGTHFNPWDHVRGQRVDFVNCTLKNFSILIL